MHRRLGIPHPSAPRLAFYPPFLYDFEDDIRCRLTPPYLCPGRLSIFPLSNERRLLLLPGRLKCCPASSVTARTVICFRVQTVSQLGHTRQRPQRTV
jgi:hypothetical protein